MNDAAEKAAEHFLREETEFHLGALLTEQSHPVTRNLSDVIAEDTRAGIALLQQVDGDVERRLPEVYASEAWRTLHEALRDALRAGKRICFSGCGATGRVSILLEAAYRRYLAEHPGCGLPDTVFSIMTGGDYALVRSVESFEDFAAYGRRQVRDLGLGKDDVLVAITEGGETSSVIGTAWQALENGCRVFFACNNPPDVLSAHVTRSREIMAEKRIVTLDLSTGPMAIAGSTRMQATTIEILAIGAALESAMLSTMGDTPRPAAEYAARFNTLLAELAQPGARSALASFIGMEEEVYRQRGAITYFAERALLDIFTDTTERAPTFMLPPFRKGDDTASPRSWAFVKNPLRTTAQAWEEVFQRPQRCLAWTADDYRAMNAPEATIANPPVLDAREQCKFLIGNEDDPSRHATENDLALLVLVSGEMEALAAPASPFMAAFDRMAGPFPRCAGLAIGKRPLAPGRWERTIHVPCSPAESPLRLWEHLALKLVLNTVSTATMARLGKVSGNWMANVETSNKKLIDRGTRLVSELAGVPYDEACRELFLTRAMQQNWTPERGERPSPVAVTIERIRSRRPRPV